MRHVILPLEYKYHVSPGEVVTIHAEGVCAFWPRYLRVSGDTARNFKVLDVKAFRVCLFLSGGAVPADVFAQFEREHLADLLAHLDVGRPVLDLELDFPPVPVGGHVSLSLKNESQSAWRCGGALFGPQLYGPKWEPTVEELEPTGALASRSPPPAFVPEVVSEATQALARTCAACRRSYSGQPLCDRGGVCHG